MERIGFNLMKLYYANVMSKKGLRRKGFVLVGRWVRSMVWKNLKVDMSKIKIHSFGQVFKDEKNSLHHPTFFFFFSTTFV